MSTKRRNDREKPSLVRRGGLEPPRLATHAPQSSVPRKRLPSLSEAFPNPPVTWSDYLERFEYVRRLEKESPESLELHRDYTKRPP
jgi:hypothetical protein